ncbi:sensor-like histidine kinase senX3 [Actinomycetes bacterium]|nr:sensor-like histidine kinase senX3 [Actinomycetes bacterium]
MTSFDLTQWQIAVDALPLGVIIFADNGKEEWRNSVASKMGGVRHTEVLINEAIDHVGRLVVAGEATTSQLDLAGPPPRVFNIRGLPLLSGGAVVTVEDVTEQLRTEKVRTDFVANLSHELKTPVGAIAILAELLEGETDRETVKKLALRIESETHRMTQMVDDLFELSGIEMQSVMQTQVNLCEVVFEVERIISTVASHSGIAIKTHFDDKPMLVLGDKTQLLSAVSNLAENAVKYSNAGGIVEMTLSHEGKDVVLSVSDQGIGIPPDSLPRIFERFYRVDKARSRGTGGSGLGLSIARHVISNHHGTLSVTSSEGEGSVFLVKLPQLKMNTP